MSDRRRATLAAVLAVLTVVPALPLGPAAPAGPASAEGSPEEYGNGAFRNPEWLTGAQPDWTTDRDVRSQIVLKGSLAIRGASAADPVYVRFVTAGGETPSIVVDGTLLIEHAVLEGVGTPFQSGHKASISGAGSITVKNSTLRNVTVSPSGPALIEHSVFEDLWSGTGGFGMELSSPAGVVRNNHFLHGDRTMRIACACAPEIVANLFEGTGQAIFVNHQSASPVIRDNHFVATQVAISCARGSDVQIVGNNFMHTYYAAFYGLSGTCAMDGNHFSSPGGDAEHVVVTPPDTNTNTLAGPRSFDALGFPTTLRPRCAVHLVTASATWTEANDPTDGGCAFVVVTGGATLEIRGAHVALEGGVLGSRGTGRVVTSLGAGGERNTVAGGTLTLAHRGGAAETVSAVDIPTNSGSRGAVRIWESAPALADVLIEHQDIAVHAGARLGAHQHVMPTFDGLVVRDAAVGVYVNGNAQVRDGLIQGVADGVRVLAVAPANPTFETVLEDSAIEGGVTAFTFGALSGTNSARIVRSAITAADIGVTAALPVDIEASTIQYNGLGISTTGATTVTGSNLYDNLVAAVQTLGTVTFVSSCARADDVLAALTGGQFLHGTPAASCPHALGFSPSYVPTVVTSGTFTLPATLAGPVIAARGGRIAAANLTIDAGADGLRFPVGAKMDGGMDLDNVTLLDALFVPGGDASRVVSSTCDGCLVRSFNAGGAVHWNGDDVLANAPMRLSYLHFRASPWAIMRSTAETRVDHALFEGSRVIVGGAPTRFEGATFLGSQVVRQAPDTGAAPRALTFTGANFGRAVSAIQASGTPLVDARGAFLGAACGAASSTCHGARVEGADLGTPAAAPHNVPPAAHVDVTPSTPASVGEPFTFRSHSTTIGAFARSETWDFGDGASASGPLVTHAYSAPGTYTVTLTVTDELRGVATRQRVVTIRDDPPTPGHTMTPASPVEGQPVTFTDTSTDKEGPIASRVWTFGDGNTSTDAVATHTYATWGTYQARLDVTDTAGQAASVSFAVNVRPEGNLPPTADFGWCCFANHVAAVAFTDASSDLDGTIASRTWQFGDGATSSVKNPTHVYPAPGSYQACLTVVDNASASDGPTCRTVDRDDWIVGWLNVTPGTANTPNVARVQARWWDGAPAAGLSLRFEAWKNGVEPTIDEERCRTIRQNEVCHPNPGTDPAQSNWVVVHGTTDAAGGFSVQYFHSPLGGSSQINEPGFYDGRATVTAATSLFGNAEVTQPHDSYTIL